jgi:crossover junction endodeoxyribonuclease RuvC
VIILGVDPGSLKTGYGAIRTDGQRHSLLEMGVLAVPRALEFPLRLRFIHEGLTGLIARLHPDVLAVEDVFHSLNSRSALVLGHVRGVILLAGAAASLPVRAHAPASVKLQVTGFGGAEKVQVALMVARHLGLRMDDAPRDATDALAVALCDAHLHGRTSVLHPTLPGKGSAAR